MKEKNEKEILEELINIGLTIKEISDNLDITYITVRRKLKKYNLKTNPYIKNKEVIICKNCSTEFIGVVRDKRKFCSKKCSIENNNKILKIKREEVNKKISNKLKKLGESKCLKCSSLFIMKKKTSKFCSRSCQSSYISNIPSVKEKRREFFSKMAIDRYKNGDTTIGWKSRSKIQPSYPEKVTMDYLDHNDIIYNREYKIGKYFIDFAFIDKKIALEIDGRTHDDESVIEKDLRKDCFLKSNGWYVFRIKWFNDGKHYDRLKAFIEQMINA